MHELPSVLWKRNCVKANLRRKIPSTLKSKKPIAQLAACKLAEGDVDFPDALFSVTGTRLNTAYRLQRNHSQWRRPDNKASNYTQLLLPPNLVPVGCKVHPPELHGGEGRGGTKHNLQKEILSCLVFTTTAIFNCTLRVKAGKQMPGTTTIFMGKNTLIFSTLRPDQGSKRSMK